MPVTAADLPPPPRVAILLQSLPMGGAEKTMLTLADGLTRQGCRVDLLLVRRRGLLMAEVPPAVHLVELGTASRPKLCRALYRLPPPALPLSPLRLVARNPPKVMRALPKLVEYLRRSPPDVLLTTLANTIVTALWAKTLSGGDTRVVACEANTPSMDMGHASHVFGQKLPQVIRQWYPRADALVGVSDGVSDDLARVLGLPRHRITTIANGVDGEKVRRSAEAPLADPWFADGAAPVLIAVGRLAPQKDYPTLLRAFAHVRRRRPTRLLILGEGLERARLEALALELGLGGDVRLAGAVPNPYSYMARARVFVLSSTWEGLPTVMIEALACGCPVVATDCPSGPREILADGAFGGLVPVGDEQRLAGAIEQAIEAPRRSARSIERARAFSVEAAVEHYLQLFARLVPARQTRAMVG